MMRKQRSLIKGQKSGSIVKVAYKSGRQPNHAREIIPIRVGNNEVLAKCLNSCTTKSFFIRKLKLLTDQQYSKYKKWDSNMITVTDYEIYEIQKEKRDKILRYCSITFVCLIIFYISVTLSLRS